MPSVTEQIPNFNLKVVFLVHFTFISISSMGDWSSNAYLFYNSILVLLLLWSTFKKEHQEPLQMAIVVNALSIFLDIVLLVMNFPYREGPGATFSAAIAILHLLIRPFSTFLLIRNLEERGGNPRNISDMFSAPRTESYEDIDHGSIPAQNTAAQSGGFTYSTAQPI